MEDKDQKPTPKPGLPDALHPEIGNGAIWAPDHHQYLLRSIDPAVSLDDLLLDKDARQEIIERWNQAHVNNGVENEDVKVVPEEKSEKPHLEDKKAKHKSKKKNKKLHSSKRSEDVEPDWVNHTEKVPVRERDPSEIIQPVEFSAEDPLIEQPENPAPVEGKRVRKALKKARQAEEEQRKEPKTTLPAFESSLSPYIKWLKGLKGSEYVHPYEDDYALDHMAESTKGGISETFADLLAAQGFRDQAISMYRQLMAKYPEKSSFFAAKIEALS